MKSDQSAILGKQLKTIQRKVPKSHFWVNGVTQWNMFSKLSSTCSQKI